MTEKSQPETSAMQANDQKSRSSDTGLANSVRPNESFSIATPAVTNTSRIADTLSESTFLQSSSSFHTVDRVFMDKLAQSDASTGVEVIEREEPVDNFGLEASSAADTSVSLRKDITEDNQAQAQSQHELNQNPTSAQQLQQQQQQPTPSDEPSTPSGKRKKGARKGAKLDTKSKLEKSRQSARECRARKKLRYQYLEDLVCNREKAVVKLREELSMFCEMSQKFDEGTLSDQDHRLLIEQTKENNKN